MGAKDALISKNIHGTVVTCYMSMQCCGVGLRQEMKWSGFHTTDSVLLLSVQTTKTAAYQQNQMLRKKP